MWPHPVLGQAKILNKFLCIRFFFPLSFVSVKILHLITPTKAFDHLGVKLHFQTCKILHYCNRNHFVHQHLKKSCLKYFEHIKDISTYSVTATLLLLWDQWCHHVVNKWTTSKHSVHFIYKDISVKRLVLCETCMHYIYQCVMYPSVHFGDITIEQKVLRYMLKLISIPVTQKVLRNLIILIYHTDVKSRQ